MFYLTLWSKMLLTCNLLHWNRTFFCVIFEDWPKLNFLFHFVKCQNLSMFTNVLCVSAHLIIIIMIIIERETEPTLTDVFGHTFDSWISFCRMDRCMDWHVNRFLSANSSNERTFLKRFRNAEMIQWNQLNNGKFLLIV